jgi:hypothetical protein
MNGSRQSASAPQAAPSSTSGTHVWLPASLGNDGVHTVPGPQNFSALAVVQA